MLLVILHTTNIRSFSHSLVESCSDQNQGQSEVIDVAELALASHYCRDIMWNSEAIIEEF